MLLRNLLLVTAVAASGPLVGGPPEDGPGESSSGGAEPAAAQAVEDEHSGPGAVRRVLRVLERAVGDGVREDERAAQPTESGGVPPKILERLEQLRQEESELLNRHDSAERLADIRRELAQLEGYARGHRRIRQRSGPPREGERRGRPAGRRDPHLPSQPGLRPTSEGRFEDRGPRMERRERREDERREDERREDERREDERREDERRDWGRRPMVGPLWMEPPRHRRGPSGPIGRTAARERIERIYAAVRHLHEAGLHGLAVQAAREAVELDRSLGVRLGGPPSRPGPPDAARSPRSPGAPIREISRQLDELQRAVESLRGENDGDRPEESRPGPRGYRRR